MCNDNNLLKKYVQRSREFNIFKVLKLEDFEIRHSNFLAWLLNPKENHGFKDEFLKNFLKPYISDIGLDKDIKIKTEVKIKDLNNFEYNGKKIDILIEGEKFTCVIENKFGSKEHTGQCAAYREYLLKQNKKELVCIFLDLDEDEFKQKQDKELKGYHLVLYNKNVLDSLKRLDLKKVDRKVSDIIKQYITILEEKYNLYEGAKVLKLKDIIQSVCLKILDVIKSYDDFCTDNEGILIYNRQYHFVPFFPAGCRKSYGPPLTSDNVECLFSYEICYEDGMFLLKVFLYDDDSGKSDKIKQILDENFLDCNKYIEKNKHDIKNVLVKTLFVEDKCLEFLSNLSSGGTKEAETEILLSDLVQVLNDIVPFNNEIRKILKNDASF